MMKALLSTAPERDPDARKQRILNAAGQEFAKNGFAEGSVREFSRQAHVNVGSINYYFGSKCVHFVHSRDVIGRLGFAVPEAEDRRIDHLEMPGWSQK